MKLFSILVFALTFWSQSLTSQTLENTTWRVYDTNGVFNRYYHFTADSMSYSANGVQYTNYATYSVNGNIMKNVDYSGGCDVNDIAEYSFILRNDSLLFTYISDLCYARYLIIALYDWVDITTGIPNKKTSPSFKVYPNPTADILNIEYPFEVSPSKFRVVDMSGRQMMMGILDQQERNMVGLGFLPKGIYILQLGEGFHVHIKVVRK